MLLLDNDDELPTVPQPSETKLLVQLGEPGLRGVDGALMNHVGTSWSKAALVVHSALSSGGVPIADDVVRLHVRRVGELVKAGLLDAQGDLRRPRFSEVRLPQR